MRGLRARLLALSAGLTILTAGSALAAPAQSFLIRTSPAEGDSGAFVLDACKSYQGQGQVCTRLGRDRGYSRGELEWMLSHQVASEILSSESQLSHLRTRSEVEWLKQSLHAEKLLIFICPLDPQPGELERMASRYGREKIPCLDSQADPSVAEPCPESLLANERTGPAPGVYPLARAVQGITDAVNDEADRRLLDIRIDNLSNGAVTTQDGSLSLTLPASSPLEHQQLVVSIEKDGEPVKSKFQMIDLKRGQSYPLYLQLGRGNYRVSVGDLVGSGTRQMGGVQSVIYQNNRVLQVKNVDPQDRRGLFPSFEVQSRDPEIRKLAGEITAGRLTTRDRVRAIHDWIVDHTEYEVKDSANALRALHEGSTYCDGYAKLFAALARASGIPTLVVTGKGNGNAHAWNEVKVDGIWLALDATFDDPIPRTLDGSTPTPDYTRRIKEAGRYRFFLLPVDQVPQHVREAVSPD